VRADRLLSIMLLLQVRQCVTARELAERLEVSKRTIYRDMDALSAAGVPVVAERGVGGGWGLLEGYKTNLTELNETEIQTLFLSKPARLLADLGLQQASETALNKLLAALPAMYRRDAEYIRQRIHIDASGWHHSEENIRFLPTLQEAIWQERKLHLVYHLSTGPIVECTLDPLGLVAKGSVWYLAAVFEGEICVYRVSRVQDAQVTDQPCVRPKGFDLAAFWKESSANYWANRPRYYVTVRIAPDLLPEMQQGSKCAQFESLEPPDAEDWAKATLQFETEEQACTYVLGCSSQIEVLEPQELRERVIGQAEGIVALYA
jgi:predicted DNA-binding transcriptional regulator YafY